MSTYQGIRGLKVRDYTTNPDDPLEGQLWYNKTDQVGKYQIPNQTASWRTAASLNTGRGYMSGCGTQTAALAFAGEAPPRSALTESYNGTAFTEVGDLNHAKEGAAPAGTATAALAAAGDPAAKAETWNGSSWTEITDINVTRFYGAGAGTQTAAIAFGGYYPSAPTHRGNTEYWNGSSWTEVADMNTARTECGGAGIFTSALAFGGSTAPGAEQATTEDWNGSAWTEVADLNQARQSTGDSGPGGTNTACLAVGGTQGSNPTITGKTELWNGSSWAEQNDLSTARFGPSGSGAGSTTALAAGGRVAPGISAVAEEWNAATPIGAWSTGNSMNTARSDLGGAGTQTAALAFGGYTTTAVANTESYNGTNWTEVNDLNTARSSGTLSATGTSTAGIYAGGRTSPGSPGGVQSVNESWDGTSWTELNDLNTARYTAGSGGTQTSALQFGGYNGTAVVDLVESWDGTGWTEVTDLNTQRTALGGTGSSNTSALAYGGLNPPGRQNETEFWNGTSWTELNNLSTARQDFGSSSALSITNVIASGGETGPAVSAATEEWTVNLANKTITAS